MKKEKPPESGSRPDWVARSLALLSAAVAITTLVHTLKKDRITLQQDIEPKLECHMAPVSNPNGNLTFALRNTSPISLSAITVDFHPVFYVDSPLRGIACGGPDSKFTDIPGFYWWTIKEIAAGEATEKKVDPGVLSRDKLTGTAALFEVSYYRPGDMRRFDEQCLFFVTPDSVKTPAELANLLGYKELVKDIQECIALKRQYQQEIIYRHGPILKPS